MIALKASTIITPPHIPFVECLQTGVVLQTALIDQELHAFEEGGSNRWWLFAKQNVNGLWCTDAQLAHATRWILTAFRILTIDQTICCRRRRSRSRRFVSLNQCPEILIPKSEESCSADSLTFVVVLVVGAILLQRYTAVWTVPSFIAAAFPLCLAGDTTLAVVRTSTGERGGGQKHH